MYYILENIYLFIIVFPSKLIFGPKVNSQKMMSSMDGFLRWSNHAKQRWWLRAELLCLDFFINSTLNFGHFLRHLAYYSTAVGYSTAIWTLLSLCSYSNQSQAYSFYDFNWLRLTGWHNILCTINNLLTFQNDVKFFQKFT